ncbi:MAG TPA: cobalamin-dependent protein [Jatrophihabitans sp.]|jgi:methylaspartate mutase sigma subunit|uniref:cobalamin-dependent protein n=1 Tax=Jatrophihabitans sp. TaxID=1932789 RepID=UPI002EF821F5
MQRLVILGVAESDAHAVANQLIAHHLRASGFTVMNLGVCTALADFAAACGRHPEAEAVLIGSLNGHAMQDLEGLLDLKLSGAISCPVIVGGNLSVGSHKGPDLRDRLLRQGVDHIADDISELLPLLDTLQAGTPVRVRSA